MLAPYANQPWNRVIFPNDPDYPRWTAGNSGAFVWDVESALRIPSVSRASQLISGMIRQCAMDVYRGTAPLERPRLLDRPQLGRPRSWFVGVQVEDYLWHGNALALVTDRNAEGWPAHVVWMPATWTSVSWSPETGLEYWTNGQKVPTRDVIHVRRGADRRIPVRGLGVVEQHLLTMDRVALEEDYERQALTKSGVPTVAVTVPNPHLSQEEADAADEMWAAKQAVRKPVFLPYGTTITQLGWSPEAAQMVEARKMSLTDVANAFNLDGYWLGADSTGLTYKSPGPMYLSLLRTTLEPILADFEQAWADAWLPRGQQIRFDRLQLTRDDFAGSIDALTKAIAPPQSDPTVAPIMSPNEARLYLGLAASGESLPSITSPIDTEAGVE
jgi:HK97 family phage portal protein